MPVPDPPVTLAEILTALLNVAHSRISNGHFSERELARKIGISQPQAHHILNGTRRLTLATADKLLTGLDLTIRDLLAGRRN